MNRTGADEVYLGLQRLGRHPPSALPHDLIDQRRRRMRLLGLIGARGVGDYGEHLGVPSRPTRLRRPLPEHLMRSGQVPPFPAIHRFQALLGRRITSAHRGSPRRSWRRSARSDHVPVSVRPSEAVTHWCTASLLRRPSVSRRASDSARLGGISPDRAAVAGEVVARRRRELALQGVKRTSAAAVLPFRAVTCLLPIPLGTAAYLAWQTNATWRMSSQARRAPRPRDHMAVLR